MQAYLINEFGRANIFLNKEIKKPKLKNGHVLIKVLATSVNPIDCKLRRGELPQITPPFPAILHGDVAGIIEEVASDVHQFKPGDAVYGCAGGVAKEQGALQEFMLADAQLIAHKPKTLSYAESAALPLVAITAWEALYEKVTMQPQHKILIHAGTGGVGHIALQLANLSGAQVYATVSTKEKMQLAKKLGAHEVINYKEEQVADYVNRLTDGHGFDIVFDTVGRENIDVSIKAIANYGDIITIEARSTNNLTPLFMKSASLHTVMMLLPLLTQKDRARQGNILRTVSKLVDDGKLKPLIHKQIFQFNEIAAAHSLLESGQAIGKVVIAREMAS